MGARILDAPPLSGTLEEHTFHPAGEPTWVLFELADGSAWAGAFGSNRADPDDPVAVAALQTPPVAYLVTGGRGAPGGRDYLVDYAARALLLWFDHSRTEGVLAVERLRIFVLWDFTHLQGVDAAGKTVWLSRRVSWDGLRNVRLDGSVVRGEAWSPLGDGWTEFALDPENGDCTGGSYTSGPWDSEDQRR